MSAYILGSGAISPQPVWEKEELIELKSFSGNRLTCVEPEYSKWLDVKQLRRMSRVMKMGAAAAKLALRNAAVEVPDAIITGTGLGCLEDTGSFLDKLIEYKEETLNPTPFIQSTHNTIGSHVAFLLQCLNYNQTYSHGAFSFESALLDAILQVNENKTQKILVGAADEITNHSHAITERFGVLRKSNENNLNLFNTKSKGTLNGEGSAWFVLTGTGNSEKIKLEGVQTIYGDESVESQIPEFLTRHNVRPTEIDLILTGKSGDATLDNKIDTLLTKIFPQVSVGLFKHLCGEYYTASSFALWLAHAILKNQKVPPVVAHYAQQSIRRVLIYNRYLEHHQALILVSQE